MDPTDRSADSGDPAGREEALEHAEHLRVRIRRLASEVAESEDHLAEVYESSAQLRPHAAPRLRKAAAEARDYAERERRSLDEPS